MSNKTIDDIDKEKFSNRTCNKNRTKEYADINSCLRLVNIQTVIDILENDENSKNPIERLIDKKHYNLLSEIDKEIYLGNVAKSYLALRKIYLELKPTKMDSLY